MLERPQQSVCKKEVKIFSKKPCKILALAKPDNRKCDHFAGAKVERRVRTLSDNWPRLSISSSDSQAPFLKLVSGTIEKGRFSSNFNENYVSIKKERQGRPATYKCPTPYLLMKSEVTVFVHVNLFFTKSIGPDPSRR